MDPAVHDHRGARAEFQQPVVEDCVVGQRHQGQQDIHLRGAGHHAVGCLPRIGYDAVDGGIHGAQAGILGRQGPGEGVGEQRHVGAIGIPLAIGERELRPEGILVRDAVPVEIDVRRNRARAVVLEVVPHAGHHFFHGGFRRVGRHTVLVAAVVHLGVGQRTVQGARQHQRRNAGGRQHHQQRIAVAARAGGICLHIHERPFRGVRARPARGGSPVILSGNNRKAGRGRSS